MNKTQLFEQLCEGKGTKGRTLFRPILMHFAARFNNKTYGEFASSYKTLVACNLKAPEHFGIIIYMDYQVDPEEAFQIYPFLKIRVFIQHGYNFRHGFTIPNNRQSDAGRYMFHCFDES